MPTSNKPGSPPALNARIDELESLLRKPAQTTPADIPVLDEEVLAPAEAHAPASVATDNLTPRQLADLGQRLQQRVDAELDDLADIIRGVVKRCILEELRKQLPPVPGRSGDAPDVKKTGPA